MTTTTYLYRHFDAQGTLLYVGISLSALNRLGQHKQNSEWFAQISNVTFELFPTRELALDAETMAIQIEKPLHNVMKRKKPLLFNNKMDRQIKCLTDIKREIYDSISNSYNGALCLRYSDAANAIGVDKSTLQSMIANKEIKVIKLGGTLSRIPAKEINRILLGYPPFERFEIERHEAR